MKIAVKRKVPEFIKRSLGRIPRLPTPGPIWQLDKIDESLTPNMRALRMTMAIAEELLAMGVAARDVVHMALGITGTYCRRRVHIDVSSTLITISQDRGTEREPLTLVRTITLKYVNYQTIQALQNLALMIRDHHLPLVEAEKRTEELLAHPRKHSRWVVCLAGGSVSMGVVILFNGSILMSGLAFAMGFAATATMRILDRWGLATFYLQIITALLITLAAGAAQWLNGWLGWQVDTTMLVISGIVLLVAGLMIVGAFQDAIDEYYVTANARLLRVTMATTGIVVGVMTGLYIIQRFGISFPTTPDRLGLAADIRAQYLGALIIAAGFAAGNHARLFGMLISGGVGVLGWWVSSTLVGSLGVVIASGAAATVVGLMAVLVSRLWRFPSVAIIAAGIVPLVPGLSLYNGLMGVIENPPTDPEFLLSLAVLARAIMIGVAIAIGASLGNMIGRPVRRGMVRWYTKLLRRREIKVQ